DNEKRPSMFKFGRFQRGPSDSDWHSPVRKCGTEGLQWAMNLCTCTNKSRITALKRGSFKHSKKFNDRCCINRCSKADVWDMCGCNNQ
ncbi:hypothetical protein PENTCL1PPCAC_29084, partial [Pristionchus entomophagus]